MSKKILLGALVAFFLFNTSFVSARGEQIYTAVDLKALCLRKSKQCMQYIAGVYDGFNMVYGFVDPISKMYVVPNVYFCPPKRLNTQHLHRIVVKYLNDTSVSKEDDASMQVYKAVVRAFPCEP